MSRRGKPVSYPWYAPDWLSDPEVRALPIAARGLYRELLDLAWMAGGYLHFDEGSLARAAGVSRREWNTNWILISHFWVAGRDMKLSNAKLLGVIEEQGKYHLEQARKAQLRWKSHATGHAVGHAVGHAEAMPSAMPPSPSPSPSSSKKKTSSQKRARRRSAAVPLLEFKKHWSAEWLRTRGKPYAMQAKDEAAAGRVLELSQDLQEAITRATRLLTHPDGFYAQGASLTLLASHWNQMAVEPVERLSPAKRARKERQEMLERLGGGADA